MMETLLTKVLMTLSTTEDTGVRQYRLFLRVPGVLGGGALPLWVFVSS